MPLVSIIMNCHNCGRYLPQALDCVSRQTFQDYEIVFWDNQSTDNSAEIARGYKGPLRYFRGEEYLALGAARNAAIGQASGKYAAFLDCDDIWLPEKLEEQVRLLESGPELGLVYADSYVMDHAGHHRKDTCFDVQKPCRGNVFNELLISNFIPLLTAVVRTGVFERAGLFYPEYEISEEHDLWLRIAEYYPVDFIEKPLAKYRIHQGGTSVRNLERALHEQFMIMQYWLDRKPALAGEIGGRIKGKKAWLHFSLMRHYRRRHKNQQAMKEFFHLVGLLPYSLMIVPRILAKLGRKIGR